MTTDSSHSKHREALSVLFASAARVAVLRVFLLDPNRTYYQRQLEAATGLPIRAVQRELERLSSIGLLYRRAEGNRTYYQVDTGFALFPELRGMILKGATSVEALRGSLALDESVVLAFLAETGDRALVVRAPGRRPALAGGPVTVEMEGGGIAMEVMPLEEFTRALGEKRDSLDPYLVRGVDLLGRRDDVIWRHIESAGYDVTKGDGVP
jgi:DNA-binding transcriptional ArsR family regulator